MLTASHKKMIQSDFAKVLPIADKAAAIFYDKLFEYDPSLRRLFHGDLKQQGKKLMSTLKFAVDSLDDLDGLVPVLQKLAQRHINYGVSVDDYTPVGNALLYTLKTGLGEQFTESHRQAWITVYKVIAEVMRSAAYPDYQADSYHNAKRYQRS